MAVAGGVERVDIERGLGGPSTRTMRRAACGEARTTPSAAADASRSSRCHARATPRSSALVERGGRACSFMAVSVPSRRLGVVRLQAEFQVRRWADGCDAAAGGLRRRQYSRIHPGAHDKRSLRHKDSRDGIQQDFPHVPCFDRRGRAAGDGGGRFPGGLSALGGQAVYRLLTRSPPVAIPPRRCMIM